MNDKTITVYNYHKSADKVENWQRTVITGVEYSFSHEKTVSSTGAIVLTQVLTVVIPDEAEMCGRKYIEYPQYQKLLDTSGNWTINPACNLEILVCGECKKEITHDYKIKDLKADHLKCGIISAFSDNTEGELLKHYKVVCK